MRRKIDTGFTIIEVLMFMAVSSALTVALLAGTGLVIQRQQYKDALYSFSSYLSEQYSSVINVMNDRPHDAPCPIAAGIVDANRGQSDCVIVGRYIETADENGRQFASYPLYAFFDGIAWQYGMNLGEGESYEASWKVKTRLSISSGADLAVLMMRDPETSRLTIRSSDRKYSPEEITGFVNSAADQDRTEICVYDTGWFNRTRQSVFLSKKAGSADAIMVANATEDCSD